MRALKSARGILGRIGARRAVFEAFLMLAALLSGLGGFWAEEARSRSLVAVLPWWAQTLYYLVLGIGGLIGLVGIMAKDPEHGLQIERAGLIFLAGHTASFGFASIAYSGLAGIPGSVMLLGFTLAAVARVFQIRGDLAAYRAFISQEARKAAP